MRKVVSFINYYYQKLLELNADGIDFFEFADLYREFKLPIYTITKQDFENNNDNANYIPKTNYRFWCMINGKKVYIDN